MEMKSRTQAVMNIAESILTKRKQIETVAAEIRELEAQLNQVLSSGPGNTVARATVERIQSRAKMTNYQRVVNFILESNASVGPKEIGAKLGVNENSIFQILKRAADNKEIKKVGRGQYSSRSRQG